MWTLQDVDDELTAGRELIHGWLTSDEQDNGTRFHRAHRHFDRAQSLLAVVRYHAQQANAATMREESSRDSDRSALSTFGQDTQPSITEAPVSGDSPAPPVFIANPTDIAKAYGGPYRGQTLVIPRGYRRWVLKDVGGMRVSVCATPEKGPSDAANDTIAAREIAALTVEGYYQFDLNGHCWEPVVQLGSQKVLSA